MLDFVYFPVSALLWCWHRLLAVPLGPADGLAWLLAVAALVVTVRALLIRPALRQARSQAVLRSLQPRVEAIRRRHSGDQRAQAEQIRALHREHGVRLFGGFVPLIAQGLVFLGLFHVLRSFDRTGAYATGPFTATSTPLSVEVNSATPNYLFGVPDVHAFLDARLFGAPLSATLTGAGDLVGPVAALAVPLVLLTVLATHLTARLTPPTEDATATLLRRMSLWVFPAGALVSGAIMPVVVLVYFATNAVWTCVQQYLIRRRIDADTAAAAAVSAARARAAAPRPGVKPRGRRR
ncbi:membrane protein insertase YidC [Nocardia asteroides NBRC 15531]|uniref:Membrane protein insertase YidC n=1 Tax=Nocardia asteroides NBRC 15531 TaxID=1110697 RepID=U5E714_NOCAS|nr:membrane protein insertase YidC [Nocardia asteroides NBRC 15531]GAD85717.1 OxaA family protein [Nocardia asteroides NBRC 15531]SFN41501.1 YidC/Oxa1 family membrane protein insertase [Nocardia asteroides]VEG36120.1 Oxa1Ec [Nocardia asteroides]